MLFALLVTNCLSMQFARRDVNWDGKNWAMSCDFHENDLSNVQSSPELCGPKCLATQGCTHYSWTNSDGGTCWMKTGEISKSNAFSTIDPTAVCGVRDNTKDDIHVSR